MWPKDPSCLALCSWGFILPTRALPGIELWSFRLCAPPVYRVLMEFKPSPFSFLPFLFSHCRCLYFPLSLQLLLGVMLFPYSPPVAILSPQAKTALLSMASLSPSSSPCAAYLLSSVVQGCADCFVNPQISFLGVQDGLVLIWLHFREERCKKSSMLFYHLVPSPGMGEDF